MRTRNTIFFVFLIISFIGCREGLINQPETSVDSETNKSFQEMNSIASVNPILKGEIPICCSTFDPLTGECSIMGKISYMHEILEYTADSVKIRLNLEMDAELCSKLMHPVKYSIVGSHVDIFFVSENGKILLDKSYNVFHRSDLRLCVQYMVTTEGVGITEMNLLQTVDQKR